MDCPDRDASFEQFLALMPRGRAWQNSDAGAVATDDSVMKKFWRAVAAPWAALEQAVCDAFLDLFCAFAIDDLDLWLEDYGLPDDCDPTGDDLCAKVAADGGDSAAYWQGVAASIGIVASFRYLKGDPEETTYPGVTATIVASVDAAASFSVEQLTTTLPDWEIGVQRFGQPDTGSLACILERALPAHLAYIEEFT